MGADRCDGRRDCPVIPVCLVAREDGLQTDQCSCVDIRASLSNMFQSTVVEESLYVFQLIESRLPHVLSQVEVGSSAPSAFDKLSQGLRSIDENSRAAYETLLQNALSGVIVGEVKKIFNTARRECGENGAHSAGGDELRISIEGDSQLKLNMLAEHTVQAGKYERSFKTLKKWSLRWIILALIIGIVYAPTYFLDYKWAYWVGVGILGLWGAIAMLALASNTLLYQRITRLEGMAADCRRPDYWNSELGKLRSK